MTRNAIERLSTMHAGGCVRKIAVGFATLTAMLVSAAATAQVIPTGPQFSVKEYPGFFFDRGSDIAVVDLDGNFVVVWATPNMSQVLGQRYDSSGSPIGAEFEMSTPSYPYSKSRPAVSSDLSGNFVVVWEHERQQSPYGGEEEILARLVDGSGPVGSSEFRVNSSSPFRHQYPSVARYGNSDFVVVWQREYPMDNSDVGDRPPGIFAQRFDPSGVKQGAEIVVSTLHGEDGENTLPDISSDLGGNFVVAWEHQGINEVDDSFSAIAARRFNSFGAPLDETEFIANSYTTGFQRSPAVAVGLDGTFVITWASKGPGEATDYGIFAKQFASTGGAITQDFLVNTLTSGFQTSPDVTVADASGHFMVVWESRPTSDLERDVKGRWFRSDARPFEDEFEIPTATVNDQEAPKIAGDVEGNFVVLWNGTGAGDPGFFSRRLEQPVLLSINDFSLSEGDASTAGDGVAVLTIEATKAHPNLDVQVEFATEDQTASSFDDYVSSNDTVVFEASTSELSTIIDIPVTGDDVFEPDETFFVHLGNAVNAAIVRESGVGTILNDDDPPGMMIGDVSIAEGDSGSSVLAFRVDLTESEQEDAVVEFSTADGTATAGIDYQAASGEVTIPGGSISGFIGVEINGDFVSEPDETLTVTLFNPTNGTLIQDQATGTILDDDCAVAITIDPPSANFGVDGGPGSLSVTDSQGCGWTAESNQPWLEITSLPSGTGSGTVDYSVASNTDQLPRNGAITVVGQSHVVIQDGVSCTLQLSPMSADYPSGGGSGSIAVADENECGWAASSNAPWLEVTSGNSGIGDGQIQYQVDAKSDPGDRTGTILVSGLLFTANQEGSFFDHFDDSQLSSSWVYMNPQFWSESDTFLRADVLGMSEEARAIATPSFGGCAECTIAARLRAEVFAVGDITLFGWYADQSNYLSLTMNEFANEWKLSQVVEGVEVQSVMTDAEPILANTLYDIELSFDGDEIVAMVDGDPLLFLTPWQGMAPQGTVGFHAAGTQAAFDLITVLTVTEAAGSDLVFTDGFESGDFSNWSSQAP